MRRKLFAAVALFATAAMVVSMTANAFAYPGYNVPCTNCHGSAGAAPTLTQTSNNGTTAAYSLTSVGGHEWAVFKGTTLVVQGTGATGTFTVPAGSTYDVYVEYAAPGTPDSAVKASISPVGNGSTTNYTITASAGANGSISPSGAQTVASGANQTFTIAANAGYHIDSLTVDGVAVAASPSYTFANVQGNHTIAATFAVGTVATYQITASAGASGSISPSGSQAVAAGSDATFTITPDAGNHVATLIVDGQEIPAATSYVFSDVSAAHTISATFEANKPLCTIVPTAGAHGSVSPATTFTTAFGGGITFVVTPDEHYHVDQVLVDGKFPVTLDDDGAYTFAKVQMDHTLSATFSLDTFNVVATAGTGGTISSAGTQTVSYGDAKTYAITPAAGYQIGEVVVDGVSVGQVSSYTFSDVSDDHTIAVSFVSQPSNFTITPSSGAGGIVTPGFSWVVAPGGSITFYAIPNAGYHIGQMLVDGGVVLVDVDGGYTFTNVRANHTVSVTFVPDPAPSKLTVKTSAKTVRVRHGLTVSGKLSGSGSHFGSTYVYIERRYVGSSKVSILAKVRVGSITGSFAYTFTPSSTKDIYVRARFAGNSSYRATTGSWMKVVVK